MKDPLRMLVTALQKENDRLRAELALLVRETSGISPPKASRAIVSLAHLLDETSKTCTKVLEAVGPLIGRAIENAPRVTFTEREWPPARPFPRITRIAIPVVTLPDGTESPEGVAIIVHRPDGLGRSLFIAREMLLHDPRVAEMVYIHAFRGLMNARAPGEEGGNDVDHD